MSRPAFVLQAGRHEPSEEAIDGALATIRAALPPSLLVLLSFHFDAMKKERAIGCLTADFHMYKGDVRQCNFDRKTSWQKHEPLERQKPKA